MAALLPVKRGFTICLCKKYRHLRNIDCLMAHTACLVCFISTVNGRSKKIKKRSLLRAALVAGTQQNLSSLYYLDVYGKNTQIQTNTAVLPSSEILNPHRQVHISSASCSTAGGPSIFWCRFYKEHFCPCHRQLALAFVLGNIFLNTM